MGELWWIGVSFGLKAGALIALGLLLVRALAPTQRLVFLRALLLAVMALPLLSGLLPPWVLPLLPVGGAIPASVPAVATTGAPALAASGAWLTWPLTLYWLSVAFLLSRFVRQLHVLRRWARDARPLSECELGDALRSGAPARIRIGWSDRVASPVSFGWPCSQVLLPAAWRGQAGARLGHALAHELAHVERRDWLWLVLIRVAHAFAWWNPMLYPLFRSLDEETELACDRRALQRVSSPADYARSLLSLACKPALAAVPMSGGRYWRRRVEHAFNHRSEELSMTKIPLVCASILIGVMMLPLAACQLVRADEPAPPAGTEAAPPADPAALAVAGVPGVPAAPMPDPAAKTSPVLAPAPPSAAAPVPMPDADAIPAVPPSPALAALREEEAALRRAEAEALRAEAAARRAEVDRQREAMAAERARLMAEQGEQRERLARERERLIAEQREQRDRFAREQAALAGEHAAMAREAEAMRAELEAVQQELETARRQLAEAHEELERAGR